MPLTINQINDLRTSIDNYNFPCVYYDFNNQEEINTENIFVLEITIRSLLISENILDVKHGLANIIYWGNANAGYQMYRTNKFMNEITQLQLQQFQLLVSEGNIPTLRGIKQLRIPQFSGISFISKIIAFIDPTSYCVLDLLISRLGNAPGIKALHKLRVTTQIGVTHNNSAAYDSWRNERITINNQYFEGRYRAVDIERGFFGIIQRDNLVNAQQIYNAA